MNADGTERAKLSDSKIDIEGYKFSPDGSKVILIKSLPYHESIKKIRKTFLWPLVGSSPTSTIVIGITT